MKKINFGLVHMIDDSLGAMGHNSTFWVGRRFMLSLISISMHALLLILVPPCTSTLRWTAFIITIWTAVQFVMLLRCRCKSIWAISGRIFIARRSNTTFAIAFYDWILKSTNQIALDMLKNAEKQFQLFALTLHRHFMHFCSPCDGRYGCHSWPFSWTAFATLHPPCAIISSGDLIVPRFEPWSPITSGSFGFFSVGDTFT